MMDAPREGGMEMPPAVMPALDATHRWRHLHFRRRKGARAALADKAASCASLKAGHLIKKGHVLPTQKERYFVLHPHLLAYFSSQKMAQSHARGVIRLEETDLVSPVATSRTWFFIQKRPDRSGKSYKIELQASTPEERHEWIEAIRAASQHSSMEHSGGLTRVLSNDRERRMTRAMTVLRARDPTVVATLLHRNERETHRDGTISSIAELRASFQMFHELVLLQSLLETIKTKWGEPSTWTFEQYEELVQSMSLAQGREKSCGSCQGESLLGVAWKYRRAFEDTPENQDRVFELEAKSGVDCAEHVTKSSQLAAVSKDASPRTNRDRCPTIFSYLSTFERLAVRSSSADMNGDNVPANTTVDARSSLLDASDHVSLSPRSATLSKYAHLYLEEEGRHRKPWSWDRTPGDDLLEFPASSSDSAALRLVSRFGENQIYTYMTNQTLIFLNPNRMLKTSKYISIYDEDVVIAYYQTPLARAHLAPHPFAMAKQGIIRLFLNNPGARQPVMLIGESGSGKTELAKQLLKYLVTVSQPASQDHIPKVTLFTSSTMSTTRMRSDESRTLNLLHAKGITSYDVVLLDLQPERWADMTSISKSKRLPQVHVDGMFFGFYETLQHLEDEEQLRMYFHNPAVAKKLSCVLDSNILLETFGHASTSMNANSSRYGKVIDVQLSFGEDPSVFQVQGCTISPFLLEKTRVSNKKTEKGERNFHAFYALIAGVNQSPQLSSLAKTLHLEGISWEEFDYLGPHQSVQGDLGNDQLDNIKSVDIERFSNMMDAMDTVGMASAQRDTIFRVLSAILWLGNLNFQISSSGELHLDGKTPKGETIVAVTQELLGLEDRTTLNALLSNRRVEMTATGEVFDVALGLSQIRHGRDTLARLLYQLIFGHLVDTMNEVTKAVLSGTSVRSFQILDVFGFENLTHNSLEQLCINYTTEKLSALEERIVFSDYGIQLTEVGQEESVLHLLEHATGLFATLEEQTLLNHSEQGNFAQAHKKDELFVRYLYQRNSWLPARSRLMELQFIIPHTRNTVTYDASSFVAKNSDFQYAGLFDALANSKNVWIQRMCRDFQESIQSKSDKSGGSITGSGSLVKQFRSQIQRHMLLPTETNASHPLFLHCLRPHPDRWSTAADFSTIEKQVHAQRLPSMLSACQEGAASNHHELQIGKEFFHTRYKALMLSGTSTSFNAMKRDDIIALVGEDEGHDNDVMIDKDYVCLRKTEMVETLEILLQARRMDAAIVIQASIRGCLCRRWYNETQSERHRLRVELMQIYGSNSAKKIEKTLRKYSGCEDELREKIAKKKRDQALIAEITSGMDFFFAAADIGAPPSSAFQDVLRDPELQRLILGDGRIVDALREVSLNPKALTTQLADPSLREFYQKLLFLLEAKRLNPAPSPPSVAVPEENASPNVELSLEDRIRLLMSESTSKWNAEVQSPVWVDIKNHLEEIGDAPEMVMFYLDDSSVIDRITDFVGHLERTNLDQAPHVSEPPWATVTRQLMQVELTPQLMVAMQNDAYFVKALQQPLLVAAIHQFMTDRQGFTDQGKCSDPLVQEYFTRLVHLSESLSSQE